jgi:Sec-independent protein translocase protein TatA
VTWPACPAAGDLPLGLLDIGPVELLILAAAAIMLFGGDLPDMARRAGQFVGRLRASAQELTREAQAPPDITRLPPPEADTPHTERQAPDGSAAALPGDPHAPPRDAESDAGSEAGSDPDSSRS